MIQYVPKQQGEATLQTSLLKLIIDALPHPFIVINASNYTVDFANAAAHQGRIVINEYCYQLQHKSEKPCDTDEHSCPLEEV